MTNGIAAIIQQLEAQRSAVENAIEALRSVSGEAASNAQATTRKGGMTPAGRRRLAEAMKRRWAAKRTGSQAKKAAQAVRKGGITAEGRRRLAESMRKRWAAKQTAAQARKRAAKKAA